MDIYPHTTYTILKYPSTIQLPPSVTHLTLTDQEFNQPLTIISSSLYELNLVDMKAFNQPIDNLPLSLKSLILGRNFNSPINHLPPSLVKLRTSANFDHPLSCLPLSLECLSINSKVFNQPMDSLPPKLSELDFRSSVLIKI